MQKKRRRITHFFDGVGISLDWLTPVVCRKGTYGRIQVFRHPDLGNVFVLNDEIQHVEAWAPLYHEPLVHLSASFVSVVKDVMIFGGGTLYAAAEALKYKSVERVIVLDYDPQVPETAAEFYDHARACFNDKRFTLLHNDAYTSIAEFRNRFDLIINDGADLMSVHSSRQRDQRHSNLFVMMNKALKRTGVCADVIYRHLFEQKKIRRTIRHLRQSTRFALSLVFLPEYHGILHILSIWGKKESSIAQASVRPKNREQLNWIKKPITCPCIYYDPRFLSYYLYLPRYLKNALATKKSAV